MTTSPSHPTRVDVSLRGSSARRRVGALVSCFGMAGALLLVGRDVAAGNFLRMRWPVDVKTVIAASGPTEQATMTEYRLTGGVNEQVELSQYGGRPGLGYRGITVSERRDKPCAFRFSASELYSGTDIPAQMQQKACADGDAGDTESATLPEGAFVNGVQVCMNADNNRVKGVRVTGVRFDEAGKASSAGTAQFERRNCKTWKEARTCAEGQIATAMRMYTRDDALVAIGLECRPAWNKDTAPQDYTLTVSAHPIEEYAPGAYRVTYDVTIKNNLPRAYKYQGGFNIQPMPYDRFTGFSCGAVERAPQVELPPNGTHTFSVSAACQWPKLLGTLQNCTPERGCAVPLGWRLDWLQEPYRDFQRPSTGHLDLWMKRPVERTTVGGAKPSH